MAIVELSKSQVRKAGQTLKRYRQSGQILSVDEAEKVEKAIVVVQQFRAAHQHPLVTANNGLRSMVRTSGCQVEVSQRLKRFNTILDKLVREPNLPLSSMQDIGGVRAILNSIDEVRRVEERLKHNRPVLGYRDYITSPRRSGYRGVHVVVEYNRRQVTARRSVSGRARGVPPAALCRASRAAIARGGPNLSPRQAQGMATCTLRWPSSTIHFQ